MKKICSQQDLDVLLALPEWEDAFLREWYLLNPGYVNPKSYGIISADSSPIMFMLICTPEETCPSIELFFEEVEEISFSCRTDLKPVASYKTNLITFSFFGVEFSEIRSKSLFYRVLGKGSWGWKVRYNKKNYFDSDGSLLFDYLD